MTGTDIRVFFDNLRTINERYLKPCDGEYKLIEEYRSFNDIPTIELLRDAYDLLAHAIVSESGNLDEYLNTLKKARVRTICELVIAGCIDLITTPDLRILDTDKADIKNQLLGIHQELTSTKREVDSPNPVSNDRLEQLINLWEAERRKIEAHCKKYGLIQS
jgi:hypothetical protein